MYNGNYDNERSAGDIIFGFKRKWDNYWYHYKWRTIIGIAALIFLVVSVRQCASQYTKRTQSDANIAYIGASELRGQVFLQITDDFNAILNVGLEEEANQKSVDFNSYFYMTSLEIENARADGQIVDMQSLMTIKRQIDMEIVSGNSVIYFLSPEAYREFSQIDGMFMSLEDAIGYVPESAVNDYCIRLSDLYSHGYFDGLYNIPRSTLVAVRNYQTANSGKISSKDLERYERNFEMLKKLIEFKPVEQDAPEEDDGDI